MTKIWNEVFWKAAPQGVEEKPLTQPTKWLYCAPIVILTALSLTIGLAAEPLYQFAVEAAEQLLDPQDYIQAVLGESRVEHDSGLTRFVEKTTGGSQ